MISQAVAFCVPVEQEWKTTTSVQVRSGRLRPGHIQSTNCTQSVLHDRMLVFILLVVPTLRTFMSIRLLKKGRVISEKGRKWA
jgi:hypothetical protein